MVWSCIKPVGEGKRKKVNGRTAPPESIREECRCGDAGARRLTHVKIVESSLSLDRELIFIPDLSKREITFKALSVPPGQNSNDEADVGKTFAHNGMSLTQRSTFFGMGHTHISGFEERLRLTGEVNTLLRMGTPTNSTQTERSMGLYSERHDYRNHLGMKSFVEAGGATVWKDRTTPLFIASPVGVSIYNNNSRKNGETILNYRWFHK